MHDTDDIELPLHRPGRSAQVRAWLGSSVPHSPPGVLRSPVPVALAVATLAWVAVACSVLSP